MHLRSHKKFINAYDKYHAGIYRFLRLKVATDEIAQDLTSEAFTKAWNIITTENKYPKNDRAYLYKTARNCLVDYYRKSYKETTTDDENLLSYCANSSLYY